jgi:hypothetical protein
MRRNLAGRAALATVLGALLLAAPVAAKTGAASDFPPPGKMRYTVTRNGDEIGVHEMEFLRDGNRFKVLTRIDVAVTIAGITVFRFANQSDEEWVDGRLASFVSTSDDDGKVHHVLVEPQSDGLWVTEHDRRKLFPGVRLIGTLWNPETAQQSLLIDPVDGRLRRVSIADHGLETVTVQGRPVQARHISIAGKLRREVWYGPDNRIVRFEFRAGDDSLIVAELR